MALPKIKQIKSELEQHAQEYLELNAERLEIERKTRELKKKLEALKGSIQAAVGVAEQLNLPYVTQVGNFYITQIKKAREVKAYQYEFVEFNVSQEAK